MRNEKINTNNSSFTLFGKRNYFPFKRDHTGFIWKAIVISILFFLIFLGETFAHMNHGFNEGDHVLEQYVIRGDQDEGLKIDPDADGTVEVVFNTDATLQLDEVTYTATDGTVGQVMTTDGIGNAEFGNVGDYPLNTLTVTGNSYFVGDVGMEKSLTIGNNLTVGGTKFVVNNLGRVGIGTDSPGNLLHINSGAGPSLSQVRLTANNLGSLSLISYEPDAAYIVFDADWDTLWTARDTSAFAFEKNLDKFHIMGKSGLTPDDTFYFVESDRQLTVLANGNIGIGTIDPDALLDIAGNLSVNNNLSVDGYYYGDGSKLTGVTAAPAGNDTEIQFNDGGSLGASASCWFNKGTSYFYAPVVSTAALLSQGQVYAGDSTHSGSIRLYDGDGDYLTMSINNFAASWSLKFPLDDGDSGEVLATDGDGISDWVEKGIIGTGGDPKDLSVSGDATVDGFIYNDSKHYAYLTLAAADNDVETNDEINFILSEGNLPHNDTTHQTTLSGGVAYSLMAGTRVNGDAGTAEIRFMWYDVTNSSTEGTEGYATSPDTNTDNTIQPTATWVVTPATDIVIELRVTSSTDFSQAFQANTWGIIEEISR